MLRSHWRPGFDSSCRQKTSAIQMDFSPARHEVVGLSGARQNKQSDLAKPSSINLIIIILAVTSMKK